MYVDDRIITRSDSTKIHEFILHMIDEFERSNLSLLNSYLGVELLQKRNHICLKQEAHALRILERSSHAECNPVQTPTKVQLSFNMDQALLENPTYFRTFFFFRFLTQT